MLQYTLGWQPQIIYAKFMNPKCCRFCLPKGDFEHTDPLPKILGPAIPDFLETEYAEHCFSLLDAWYTQCGVPGVLGDCHWRR